MAGDVAAAEGEAVERVIDRGHGIGEIEAAPIGGEEVFVKDRIGGALGRVNVPGVV